MNNSVLMIYRWSLMTKRILNIHLIVKYYRSHNR